MTPKVNFVSPIVSTMGYAEMARRVWAQVKAKGDVGCLDIGMQPSKSYLGSITQDMLSQSLHKNPDQTIINMVPILWDKWKNPVGTNIGFTTFEASKIPLAWANKMNQYDAIMTTTEWNKSVFEECGVTRKIEVISPKFVKQTSGQKNKKFRFHSSFQWSGRKNFKGLISAFAIAFDQNPDVELVIKTHITGNDKEDQQIIGKQLAECLAELPIESKPKILIVCGNLSKRDNKKLLDSSHVHISLSHGEGWGLPAWEALESGIPTIMTNWGAYGEWGRGSPLMVNSQLTPCVGMSKSISPFFDSTMRWAEPSLDHAISLMKLCVDDYQKVLDDTDDWIENFLVKKYG